MRSLLVAGATCALLASLPSAAQTFSVGAGGAALNDTGTAANVSGFRNSEFHVFVEGALEPGVTLQVRAARFTMPGAGEDAVDVRATSLQVSVGYEFRQDWWRAGFFGGGGLYRLSPRDPELGQIVADRSQDVFGWHGGVTATFALVPKLDLRLEASVHSIRSDEKHTPILLGGSVAYRF